MPTESLTLQALKLHVDLRADGSTLRKLQQRVGENKATFQKIMDELTRRGIINKQLEIPFGHSMKTLFDPKNAEKDSGGE